MPTSTALRSIFVGSLLFACHAAAAQTYTYTEILPPGSTQTTPVALDGAGVVLGYWLDGSNDFHGFTYNNGVYANIDYPKAIYTQPTGFNEKGEIIGSYTDTNHIVHAFSYVNGKFKTLVAPGSNNTETAGINHKGAILGYSSAGSGSAFVYSRGQFTTINAQNYVSPVAINDSGSAIGDYFPPQPQPITTWYYSGGTLITLPIKSSYAESFGLNDKGEIVGQQIVGNTFEGFLYGKGAKAKSIVVPNSTGTYPEGISDQSDITGYYTDSNFNEFGFVLSKGVFSTLSAPNAAGTYGLAINEAGQVLGGYHDANRVQFVFLATPSK